jgi:hypothetical protein
MGVRKMSPILMLLFAAIGTIWGIGWIVTWFIFTRDLDSFYPPKWCFWITVASFFWVITGPIYCLELMRRAAFSTKIPRAKIVKDSDKRMYSWGSEGAEHWRKCKKQPDGSYKA